MRPIGTIAAGLVLVSGTAVAQAQTAVTRQITSEPVETVVTQGPNGTAVTRRILSPEPGVSTYAVPPLDYGPVATETVEQQYVARAAAGDHQPYDGARPHPNRDQPAGDAGPH